MKEKWREIYSEDQIKKIQELEMMNLKEIKRVCEILNIQFFLYGGSLIGAVRHKGFVPWDDDLDIAMLRKDYEIFIREAPKLLSNEFFLQNPLIDKKTPYFYTKLRLKDTKCIEWENHKLNIEQGIYVDIYPIDNLPTDDKEYLRMHSKFQKWVRLFVLRQCPYGSNRAKNLKARLKGVARKIVSLALKTLSIKFYIKKINSIMTAYNESDTGRYGNYSFPRPVNTFSEITPFEKVLFNNVEVNLPKDWDGHLTRRYGNYMEFPPEEERIGHKPYVLDFGPYFKEKNNESI